jgi:hypothetical protein
MKTPLDSVIEALSEQNVIVGRARNAYLAKESERKTFESRLIQAAEGKSQAEKLMNAQATDEWLEFSKALARLEAVYEFEKFKLTILDREYQAQYLEIKDNGKQIVRGA